MRRVIGGAFISLDGVVQAPGGPEEDTTGSFAHGGWMKPVFDEGVGRRALTCCGRSVLAVAVAA